MHTVHIGTGTAYAYRTHTVNMRLVAGNMVSHFKTEKPDFGFLGPFEKKGQKWQKSEKK
jgi:uncharacterized phage-like protein YoqJ